MEEKKTLVKRMVSYFLFIVTFFVVLPAQASVEPPRFEAEFKASPLISAASVCWLFCFSFHCSEWAETRGK